MGKRASSQGKLPRRAAAKNPGRSPQGRHNGTSACVPRAGVAKPGQTTQHEPIQWPTGKPNAGKPVPTQPKSKDAASRPPCSAEKEPAPSTRHAAPTPTAATSDPGDASTASRTPGARSGRISPGTTIGPTDKPVSSTPATHANAHRTEAVVPTGPITAYAAGTGAAGGRRGRKGPPTSGAGTSQYFPPQNEKPGKLRRENHHGV